MTFKNIPDAYKINTLVEQKTYLVNGEIKEWSGADYVATSCCY